MQVSYRCTGEVCYANIGCARVGTHWGLQLFIANVKHIWLVVWNMNFIFHVIYGRIILID